MLLQARKVLRQQEDDRKAAQRIRDGLAALTNNIGTSAGRRVPPTTASHSSSAAAASAAASGAAGAGVGAMPSTAEEVARARLRAEPTAAALLAPLLTVWAPQGGSDGGDARGSPEAGPAIGGGISSSISPVRAHGRGHPVPADAAALLSRSLPTFPSASLAPATSTASSSVMRPYALSRHPGTADKNFPKEDVPMASIFAPYSERAAGARGRGRVGAGTDGDHLRSVSPHRRPRRGTTPGGSAAGSRRALSPHTAAAVAVAVGSSSPTMTHSFGVGTNAGTGRDGDGRDDEELAMAAGRRSSALAAAAAGTGGDDGDDGDDGNGGGNGEGLALGGALDNDSPRLPPPRHAPDAAADPADEAPTTAPVAAAAAASVSSAAGRSTARQPVPLTPHGVTVDGGLLNAVGNGNGSGRRGRSQPKSRGQRALPTPVDAATAIMAITAMTAGGLHDMSWSMTDSLGGEGEGSLGRYLLSICLGPYLDPYLGPYLGPYLKGEGSLGRCDRPLSPTRPWQILCCTVCEPGLVLSFVLTPFSSRPSLCFPFVGPQCDDRAQNGRPPRCPHRPPPLPHPPPPPPPQ